MNKKMLRMCEQFGFRIADPAEPRVKAVALRLDQAEAVLV